MELCVFWKKYIKILIFIINICKNCGYIYSSYKKIVIGSFGFFGILGWFLWFGGFCWFGVLEILGILGVFVDLGVFCFFDGLCFFGYCCRKDRCILLKCNE